MHPTISVIIPVLNEERNVVEVITQTRLAGQCEIIVVDGGSSDATQKLAAIADQVLVSAPGRAIQQNVGARHADGDILVFLHADCRVTCGFGKAIVDTLSDLSVVAGCFRQRIDHPGQKYRLLESGNAWRVRYLGWIYGDQGLFLRKETFVELGGFPEIPLMEDLQFSKTLKRLGRLKVVDHPLEVSSRRWEKRGVMKQTLSNWSFVAMAHAGVSFERLARWYGHVRESDLSDRSTHSEARSLLP